MPCIVPSAQRALVGALAEYVATGQARDEVVVATAHSAPWAPEPVVVPPPAAPAVQLDAKGTSNQWMRTGAYVTGGVGLAALTVAGVTRLAAQGDSRSLSQRLTANGRIPAGDAEAGRLRDSLRKKNTVIAAGLITGGAALVSAGTMFYLSRDSHSVAVAVTPSPRGLFAEAAVRF